MFLLYSSRDILDIFVYVNKYLNIYKHIILFSQKKKKEKAMGVEESLKGKEVSLKGVNFSAVSSIGLVTWNILGLA